MKNKVISSLFVFGFVLLALTCANGQAKLSFQDFSDKFPNLAGLRLATSDVVDLGKDSIDIFGKTYAASKYSFSTTITVQTVSTGIYEKVPAKFEIFVAEDESNAVRDKVIESMYGIWSRKELYSGEYFFDFISKDSNYSLTVMPDLVNVKGYYYIWLDGRLVKILFAGFQKVSGGWGVMDSFTADNLRIDLGRSTFKAYNFPLGVRKSFLKLYKAGYFGPNIKPKPRKILPELQRFPCS